VVWGGLYYVNDEPLAAAVPWSYVVLWLLTTLAFSRHRNYATYEFTQLVMIIMLPFVLQMVLGGFLNSSAVVL
jgi:guanylate cyclase